MQSLSQKQMKYILKNIPKVPPNDTGDVGALGEILGRKHCTGADMGKASQLLKALLDSKPFEFWIGKMKRLRVNSTESTIHTLEILPATSVIVKVPKKTVYHENNLRSFYNGWELNKLRYVVPNFAYTFCLCSYQEQLFVVQEHVKGETLDKVINTLTFAEFLSIFSQILLALEVAQRQCSLCHYDLHVGNVILLPIEKPCSYTVVLDSKRYDIVADKWIPIIIDFGLSSTEVSGKTIGPFLYTEHGIFNYPIQGSDMYKFLFHSYAKAKGTLQREIGSLFLFYGTYDPYKILVTDTAKLPEISKQYLRKITESYVATNTPEEFLTWILENPEYPKVMAVRERDLYHPITSAPTKTVLPEIPSYIMLMYMQKFTEPFRGANKEKYIENDRKLLERYVDIPLPEELVVRDHANRILGTQIKNSKEIEKLLPIFIAETEFTTQLEPYFQYLYTIRELDIEDKYQKFIEEFTNSSHYELYIKLKPIIVKTRRWSHTLFLSM